MHCNSLKQCIFLRKVQQLSLVCRDRKRFGIISIGIDVYGGPIVVDALDSSLEFGQGLRPIELPSLGTHIQTKKLSRRFDTKVCPTT